MTRNDFIKVIGNLYTEEKMEKLEIYKDFLIEYNKHTNLTAITNEEDIYLKHFYDSLTITRVVDLNNCESLLDVGTGAGFPGMVLKIFYPNLDVTLLDSNNKKAKFLEELAKKLNIKVNVINDRAENFAKDNLNKFDVVTARAVANLRVLSEICLPLVKENGLFIPLKGNINNELTETLTTLDLLNSKLISQETFYLQDKEFLRNILVIRKVKKTNSNILRSYAQIIKKPLKKPNK